MALRIRPATRADWPAVAALIHDSTNAWYRRHARPAIFRCEPHELELFCRVYEDLEPGCCLLAEDGGTLAGSCFYHPRATHVSLGIMNAHPDAAGRGVARRLLEHIVAFARGRGLPVRLVSSALNLDSFSLYSRAGFRPWGVFQDMVLAVPESGLTTAPSRAVRPATMADVPAIVALESELVGIDRERDFRYLIENAEGIWHLSVADGERGLDGFLGSVAHAASRGLGPGVARDDDTAFALILAELDRQRGAAPVVLIPAAHTALVEAMYGLGARNCELHLGQALGAARPPAGVVLPTFMPETG